MAGQNPNLRHNQPLPDAIATVEQLMMHDDDYDDLDYDPDLVDDFMTGVFDDHPPAGNQGGQNPGFPPAFGNPIQIHIWPVPPAPHTCSCCQPLREILHTDGTRRLKLEVHGRVGLISHAVLDTFSSSEDHEYHMFDFCNESIISVRQFLNQYCNDRKREGFIMLQDPLSKFYKAVSYGLGVNHTTFHPPHTNQDPGFNQSEQDGNGAMSTNQDPGFNQPEQDGNGAMDKSFFAWQRERASKLTFRDLAQQFHLPQKDAANAMQLCLTAVKNACTRLGLTRWPYRKIKRIEGEISKKKRKLESINGNDRARVETEIQALEQKLARLYETGHEN